jgi:GDPmannose 4,6-dehydratase
MSKTIIVTGLNGQLGQHLVKFFQEKLPEFKIVGTVRQKSYDYQPKIFDESKVTKEILDLADSASIETIVSKYKPDYIFNTAALAHVGESWHAPLAYAQFDGVAVVHFLEAIRKHSPNSKFLNLGTSEEMGCTLEDSPNGSQDETTRLVPKSPYACAKLYARTMVDVYRNSYNIYAIQPWTFNFESKLRGEKYVTRKITKGVGRIYRALKDKNWDFEPISLGNVNSHRSWQHAADVAEGLWLIVNQPGEPKDWKPYVLSENATHTVREFVEKAFRKAGIIGKWFNLTPENPLTEEFILCGDDGLPTKKKVVLVNISKDFFRPHDVDFLFGRSDKIRQELGWTPKYSFDDLLEEMVLHDLKNP